MRIRRKLFSEVYKIKGTLGFGRLNGIGPRFLKTKI